MKKILLSLVGFLCSLVTIQAEVVTFSATGQPATWSATWLQGRLMAR